MSRFEDFLKTRDAEDRNVIDALYDRVDRLSDEQLAELLRYGFKIFGDVAFGMTLVRRLIEKINKQIGCDFQVKEKSDFEKWLTEFFEKTDLEKQRAVFVTMVFDVYKTNVISSSNLIHKIDEALSQLNQTPEFKNTGKKGAKNAKGA